MSVLSKNLVSQLLKFPESDAIPVSQINKGLVGTVYQQTENFGI